MSEKNEFYIVVGREIVGYLIFLALFIIILFI